MTISRADEPRQKYGLGSFIKKAAKAASQERLLKVL